MCISAKDVRIECDDSSNYVEIGNESDLNQPFKQKWTKISSKPIADIFSVETSTANRRPNAVLVFCLKGIRSRKREKTKQNS